MWKLFKLLILILFCTASLGLALRNPAVSARASKTKVTTGEVFACKIKIEGDFRKPRLTLPEFKDFKIASQSQSRNYITKRGQVKLVIEITYHIFAVKPGVFTIEPVIVEDQDKKHRSKAITIKVIGKPLEEKKKISPYIEKGTKL